MIHSAIRVKFLITAFLFSASLSLNSYAFQPLEGVEGEVLTGKISIKEVTRISVSGGKIQKWFFNEGELILEKDVENGQLFVRPTKSIKPVNIFIVDNLGRTYTLLLEPTDIPAESIVIKDRLAKHSAPSRIERTGSFSKVIKNMILAMATDSTPSGIEVREMHKDIMLWRESKFTLNRLHIGKSIVGERYLLKNVSQKTMVVAEQELFKRGILAVSIENMNLAAGESTNVFIVREKGENE